MTSSNLARFAALASLWSLQFLFLRLAVPAFGTPMVAEGRALFGALVVVPAALFLAQRIAMREHWRTHLGISLANNVLPFILFAFAATTLPAGYLAIINGTVPLWTALFSAWLLGEGLGGRRLAGFVLGLAGVALIVNLGPVALDGRTVLAALCAVAGASLWGYAGVLIKQSTGKLAPLGLAAGSLAFSTILMSPAWVTVDEVAWSLEGTASLAALGALCTGTAYVFFFRLVRDIGPARTLSVGFLIPVLGVLWGWLFLDEAVTLTMVAGGALVLAAMALVLRR